MKKTLCMFLAFIMLATLAVVPANARGYTLSVPKTVSGHNLNSYGLKTLKVYQTNTPPVIDGKVKEEILDEKGEPTGEYKYEYPGPDGGMTDCVYVKGEEEDGYYNHGLWMSSHSAGNQGSYSGNLDFTGFTAERDVPQAVETYLTYDDDYLYFDVIYRHIPAQTSANVAGRTSMTFDTRVNFIQSDNPVEIAGSVAWNRYNITTNSTMANSHQASSVSIYNAYSSTRSGRQIRQIEDGKDVTHYVEYYVSDKGTAWGNVSGTSAEYRKLENFYIKINVLDDSFTDEIGNVRDFWDMSFEGRMPLGDILRISDVVYEDGSPIDYVPEWGAWGSDLRYFSTATVTNTATNGSEVTIEYDEAIYAQTMLPAGGMATTGVNSRVANYEFHNTVSGAFVTAAGLTTNSSISHLLNPVHFLGLYDGGEFDMDYFYYNGVDTSSSVATSSTRATRRRDPYLKEFDGSQARVIGVSTQASSPTGDPLFWTIVAASAMLICAAGAVTLVLLNKKKRNSR